MRYNEATANRDLAETRNMPRPAVVRTEPARQHWIDAAQEPGTVSGFILRALLLVGVLTTVAMVGGN